MEKIVVGLSGGVDSSVAAATLHRQGYDVVGLTLWLMKGKGQCCSEGMVDAAKLCEDMGIPHHIVDSRDVFQKEIVDYLVEGYGNGITPLPCSQCNRAVKFGPMLQYAREELGCDRIATGHYARISITPKPGATSCCGRWIRRRISPIFCMTSPRIYWRPAIFPWATKPKPKPAASPPSWASTPPKSPTAKTFA